MSEVVEVTEPEIVEEVTTLSAEIQLAERLAKSDAIPKAYKNKPEDILLAIGYGAGLGLRPVESLTHIYIIGGRPAMYGTLFMSQINKAGFDVSFCTEIAKANERGFENITVTMTGKHPNKEPKVVIKDLKWAVKMGIPDKNPEWGKQPETMLKWRCVSEFARLYCPEYLFGVNYTPEELKGVEDVKKIINKPEIKLISHKKGQTNENINN